MSQFSGHRGTLIIVASRAKGLPNKRKLEKQNPYCLLRISNLTDKTKADIRGGQVPRWDEEFRFNITPELPPILKLSVLDETKKAPTLVAETEIDFTPVFYASVKDGFDKWHPLSSAGRDAGSIYLEMTFYPSGGNAGSGSRKSMTASGGQSSPIKRLLPPLPGQQIEQPAAPEIYSIPSPVPRNVPLARSQEPLIRSHGPDFSTSHMSMHSLPDVPRVNSITKELPPVEREEAKSDTGDWMAQAKKWTSHYASPLFGKAQEPIPNAFDELEKEVQSDFANNGKQVRNQEGSRAPPLPSHSSGSSRSFNPPPVPQHSGSFQDAGSYDVIEPERCDGRYDERGPEREERRPHDGGERRSRERRSPTRKAPQSFYRSGPTSPAKLDLSSIPFDAHSIDPTTQVQFGDRLNVNDDGISPQHHAPTPYDVFGGSKNSASSSGSRSRMSPTRFKTSLPPR